MEVERMVQPSKRSLSAQRRHAMDESDRNSVRSILLTLVLIGFTGLLLILAGLAVGLDFGGIQKPASSSLSSGCTNCKNTMESIQVDKKQAPQADFSGYLTLVSMNVAGCVPSKMAPEFWTHQNSVEAIKAEIIQHRPDWIALQEVPGGVEVADQVFGPEGYKAVGATYSHADHVVLLVKKEIDATLIPTPSLPVVMAELKFGTETGEEHRLLVASVHLEPFKQGFRKRALQMQTIVTEAKSLPIIIAGDTNMRQTEDGVMEGDLQLLDVWKLAGSNPRTKFTWDTVDHRNDAAEKGEDAGINTLYFNQYYGETTRQYNARYDRIYIHHANHSMELDQDSAPVTFDLIANKPMTSKLDFLSDHFGVVSKLPIKWK